jgi:hypothetical protein
MLTEIVITANNWIGLDDFLEMFGESKELCLCDLMSPRSPR